MLLRNVNRWIFEVCVILKRSVGLYAGNEMNKTAWLREMNRIGVHAKRSELELDTWDKLDGTFYTFGVTKTVEC